MKLLAIASVLVASMAIAAPLPLTPAHQKFVKEMGASFDELVNRGTKAEAAEHKQDFANAAAEWTGVKKGAEALERNAALAARVGSFREPMRFATKSGTLTPKQYLAKLRALAATADVRGATDRISLYAQRDKQAKRGFVEWGAMQLATIEASSKRAGGLPKAKANEGVHLVAATLSVATELRKLIAGAMQSKRIDAAATFPVKPTALTGAQMLTRVDKAVSALQQQAKALAKLVPKSAVAKAPVATKVPPAGAPPPDPTPSPSEPDEPTSDPAVAVSTPAPAPDPDVGPVGPIPGETCNEAYSLACDAFNRPCCPGLECLAYDWVHDDASPPFYSPTNFKCMEPLNAPLNPNHPFN